MQKRLLRYTSALIVSLVTTFCGLHRYAAAEPSQPARCSLSDVSAWQMALDDPQEEATPAYVQRVTESFIKRCPDRPEIASAHRVAAMAAAYGKKPDAAARHFDKAGYVTDAETLMMHAAVAFATGEPAEAWRLRDEAIEFWISRMLRRGFAEIEISETEGGELIGVHFGRADPDIRVSDLWIAKPYGPGWPAALSVSSERQLNALFQLRTGSEEAELRHVRLYRCASRRILARTQSAVEPDAIADAARLALTAYLAEPDLPEAGGFERCLFADAILPELDPALSMPIQ